MNISGSKSMLVVLAASALSFTFVAAQGPAPAAAPGAQGQGGAAGGGGGGRGRGGLPGATPEQTTAVVEMSTALAPLVAATTAARSELASAAVARNDAGIRAAVDKLRDAELALATARADAFGKLQAGPNKLNAEQVTAFIQAGGTMQAGRGGAGGGAPGGAPARGAGGPGGGAGRGN